MITDENVRQIANDILMRLANNLEPGETLPTQIYRGVTAYKWKNQHEYACNRHMHMFNKFNAISEYCFDCLKISIKPRNVIELIKLLIVFDKLELPNDNTRKCLVECRDNIPGTYTGLVYCIGIEEAQSMCRTIEKVVMEEISNNIPVFIKRGCSEHDVAFPGFAKVIPGQKAMEYNDIWSEYEEIVDKEYVDDSQDGMLDSHNEPTYTIQDAKAVYLWLMYAATIGDLSYLDITGGGELPALTNIKRPPFE